MNRVVEAVLSLSGLPAYALVFALAAGEAAVFLGVFLPGEAALLLGGVLASQGRVSLPAMVVTAVLAAVIGDSIGYQVGRWGGPAMRSSRLGRLVGESRWKAGEGFLLRRGGPAVLLGRWVGLLRALVPSLAGMGAMPYRSFLAWNAAGGTLWASTVVLLGYVAGAQYARVERLFGRAGLLLGLVVAVAGVVLLVTRAVARRPGGWPAVRGRAGLIGPLPAARRGASHLLTALVVRLPARQAFGLVALGGLGAAVLAGTGFGVVLDAVLEGDGVTGLDRPLLVWLAGHRDGAATAVARTVTQLGGVPFVLALTAVLAALWWRTGRRREPLLLTVAVLGGGAVTGAVKLLVHRDRPVLPLAIDRAESGFAFPSGHSLSALVLYGTLAYLVGTAGWPRRRTAYAVTGLLLTATAVALSRLYLGYHWLSDVLGSWTLAVLWLSTVFILDHLHGRAATWRQGRSAADRPGVEGSGPGPARAPEDALTP